MSHVMRPGDTADAFERALLASARGDQMSPRAKHALVAAFAGGALAGGAAGGAGGALREAGTEAARSGTSSAASTGLAALTKWVLLGSVVAALALVGAVSIAVHRRTVVSATRVPVAAPHEEVRSIPEPAALNVPPNETRTTGESARIALSPSASPPSHRRIVPAPVALESAGDNAASSLAAELRIIERAQAAQREGRPRDALSAVDEHEARFPGGALADEAAVLRIEANATIGEAILAARLARQFLAAHPSSPYEARVRRVVRGPEVAAPENQRQ